MDLSQLLHDWPHEPGKLNVRIIEGDDGVPRLQVRLDLGLLQMELFGRPDGRRPHGYDSLLEFLEHQIDEDLDDQHRDAEFSDTETTAGTPESEPDEALTPPTIAAADCRALREESAQYYHRYVALFVLDDFEGVVRDTTRSLRVLDLCAAYAEEESDQVELEPLRAYLIMLRARALASIALRDDEPKAALLAIDHALEDLTNYHEARGEDPAESSEIEALRAMRGALVPKLPVSQKAELRARIREAIERENFELAAILRDELRMLGDA